jgi:hypothetical protein
LSEISPLKIYQILKLEKARLMKPRLFYCNSRSAAGLDQYLDCPDLSQAETKFTDKSEDGDQDDLRKHTRRWVLEKLSSILPTSPRVSSVDMDEAPPARPGSPSMGRKEGRNSVNDRVTLSARAKELAAQDTMMGRKPKEEARAKIVSDMTANFFNTRLQKKEKANSEVIADNVGEAIDLAPVSEEPMTLNEPMEKPSSSRLSIEA